MKTLLKTVGAIAVMSWTALPAAAAVDVPALTCGAFNAMDGNAKLETATEVLAYIHADNSTNVSPNIIGKYAIEGAEEIWDGEKLKVEIEGHCVDAAPDITVLERLEKHS